MEATGVFAGLGCAFAFSSACLLGPFAYGWLSYQAKVLFAEESGAARRLQRLLRNGVGPLRGIARFSLRFRWLGDLCDESVACLSERGYFCTSEALCSLFLCLLAAVLVLGAAISQSALVALAVCAGFCAAAVVLVRNAADKRREALRDEVPEAIRSMTVCFRSGYTLMQTLQQVQRETHGPLQALFAQAAHRMEAGQGASQALGVLRENQGISELVFLSVALEVQHRTGGSMVQILQAACESVESQIELRRSLRVQTAQAKLSARIVSVMPFLLIAVFSLISKGFLDPFFASPLGFALLGLALGMQAAGIVLVRRVLAVEVVL